MPITGRELGGAELKAEAPIMKDEAWLRECTTTEGRVGRTVLARSTICGVPKQARCSARSRRRYFFGAKMLNERMPNALGLVAA